MNISDVTNSIVKFLIILSIKCWNLSISYSVSIAIDIPRPFDEIIYL